MKILIADKIDPAASDILKNNGLEVDMKTGLSEDEIARIIHNYEGILVRSAVKVTPKIIEAGNKLKVIGRAGVGVDNIDIKAATNKGIVVMNTPLGNVNAAAEHTVAMILALSRHIHKAHTSMKEKRWDRKLYKGNELRGKIIGIMGVGNVGKIVAKIMQGFNAEIYGYDPFLSEELAKKLGINLVDMETLLKNSDYITLHIPLNDKTRNIIDKKEFEKMKDTVKVINVSRGGLINENALYEALKKGKISGAAIDVWESEPPADYKLAELENVLATPHLGASTEEAQKSVAIDIAKQASDFLNKGIIHGAVNISSINPEDYEAIKPYFNLMEKLGSICVQIIDGGIGRIEVHYRGRIAESDTKALTPYAVKGILKKISGENINEVNSMHDAKNKGIKVVENSSPETENFTNLIRVIIKTSKGEFKVNGTIFDDKAFLLVSGAS